MHNLTPLGPTYRGLRDLVRGLMRIDPHFDMWNYFFCVRCLQDWDAELTFSREAVTYVKSRHGIDPYFNIPMPDQ
jgi:hypothetical protein